MGLDFTDPFEEKKVKEEKQTPSLDFKDPFEKEVAAPSPELSEPNRLRAKYGFDLIEDVPAAIPEPEGRTVLGAVGDIGVSAVKGAVGLVQAGVGLADIPTGGRVVKAIEDYTPIQLEETQKILEDWYSDPQKKAFQEVAETEGFFPTVGAMLERPSTILQAGIESAPSMIGGAGIARGILKVAPKLGLAAMAAGEGAIAAGMGAEQLREEAESGRLTGKEAAIAIGLGLGTGFFGLLGARIAGKLGIADIDTAMAGLGSDVGEKGIIRRIVEGGISEGILEEAPQSAQEQIWMNAAQNKPLLEGVPESAAAGMLVGAGMGGGANILARKGGAIPSPIEDQDSVDAAITEDIRKPTTDELVEEAYQRQQAERPAAAVPEKETDIQTLLREIQEAKAEEAVPGERIKTQELVEEAYIRQQAIPTEAIESQETVDEQIRADVAPEPGELPTPDTEAQQAYFRQIFADTQAAIQPEVPIQAELPMAIPTEEITPVPTERKVGERDGLDLYVDDTTGDLIVEHPSGSRMIERTIDGNKQYEVIGDYADFGVTKTDVDLKNAREVVDVTPTDAQIEAGNYKKGHVKVQGLDITIENPEGSERTGKEDGDTWTSKMHIDYGYIKKSEGADGEHIDVYIGPNPESDTAYAVHQIEPETGKYDEDKVMIGFDSQKAAEAAYRKQYDQGMKKKPNRIGAITSISMDVLKDKIAANETIGEEAIKQIEFKPEVVAAAKEIVPAPPSLPLTQEGDIFTKAGKPFKTESAARTGIVASKKQDQGFVSVEVEGGWVARSTVKKPKITDKKADIIPTRADVVAIPIEKDLQPAIEGDIFNREEVKRRIKDGLYIHDRIPRSARDKAKGSNLEAASNVARRSLRSDKASATAEFSQIPIPIDRKKPATEIRVAETEALRQFAKKNDLLIPDFETNLTKEGNVGGGEAYVYYDAPSDRFMKANFFAFTPTFSELFDRVMIHNLEFESSSYTLEGFAEVKGEFLPIFSQPNIKETQEVDASEKERLATETLKKQGYREVKDAYPWPWQDVTDSKFINSDGVVVSDINARNMVYVNGDIAFIDPIIEMDSATKADRVNAAVGEPKAELKIAKVEAEHNGEPVTKAETKDILEDAKEEAKDEGVTATEQKTFLLSEIDEGLKEAPSEAELEGVAPRDFGRVKIEVPGDGTFDIVNTKEALTEFRTLVKKNFPGKEAAKKVAKRFVTPKPAAGKAKALKDVRQGIYEGKPYHTDGHVILLTKPALKPKQIEDSRWEDRPTIDASIIKDLIPKGGDKVTDIEFVAYEAGESQSISNLPIPDLREDKRFTGAPKARLISEKGEVYIGQEYYNYVIRHFPDATFYTTDEVSPVLVKDGKKTVGIVMPIRIEAAEVGVKEVRRVEEVGGTEEKLAEGTFQDSSLPVNTGVNARMVVIDKVSGEAPVLSRAKDYLGEGFPVEKVGEKPSVSDIRAIIDIITTKWKNAPKYKVVQSIDRLPQDLQDYAKSSTGEGAIEGMYYQGKVYLIANKIVSGERAATVFYHEALGHFGINELLGDDARPILNQIYIKYRKEAQKIAIQYKIDLSKEAGRVEAAGEVLAGIAQKNSDPGILKKVIAAIRDWLRKMKVDIKLSDNDIIALVARAARFVKKGERKAPPLQEARKEAPPVFAREHTPAVKAALEKVAPEMETETVKERLAKVKENLGIKIKQAVVDQYASLKEFTKHGYMLARMSNTASGKLEAAFRHGKLRMLKSGAITVDTTGKGLANVLAPLGGELNDFFAWIAGNRAEGLAKEDRERLFDKTDIEALKTLNQGNMADGKVRAIVYGQVHKEFKDFQKSVLDIAEQSGLVNKEERETWEQDFYVPFYRVLEEQADTQGPKTLESLTGQTAIKRLKGADIKLNDLLSNVLMNWNHLIGASLKNNAAKVSLEAAVDMNVATQIKESEKTASSVFVRENGRKVWYDVSEPLVLESLTSLNWDGFNSRALKAMRKFKRAFTIGVTASPEFRIANLLRDTIQSVAVGKMNYNVFDNVFGAGWKGTKRESLTEARMMAGGGMMHFGHEYGADPDAARLMIEKGIKDDYVLNNPKAFKGAKQALNTFWDTWREFGSRLENVNRAALYEKRVKEVGELKANFEARDLMDFTNYGAAPAVRFLIQVVPFLNARMQGLYKLGGAAVDKDQQRQLAAVTSMVALASMALFLTFKDDDDFKEREEWDRDTYWWFKVPGSDKAFRIPKPFEVGAIGTLAERMLEQIVDDEVHGELFAERMGHMIVQTFAFSVVPQMLQPTLDIYSNINPFTDRPIESMGMERLSKTERKRAWTSETTIAISKGMDAVLWDKVVLSPVQVEYLVKGYLGWIGAMTLGTIDNIFMEPLTGAPTDPTRRIDDYPAVGRFVRSNPVRNTKYATLFYEQLKEMNTAYSDVQNYRKLREFNKARESRQKNIEKLRWRTYFNKQQKRLSGITGRMKLIQLNKVMSAEAKRTEIDLLQREKNRILKIAVERRDI